MFPRSSIQSFGRSWFLRSAGLRKIAASKYDAAMHLSTVDVESIERRYEADGFVKIEPFLDAVQLDEIERELAKFSEEVVAGWPAGDVIWEPTPLPNGGRAVRNLFRINKHSDFFYRLGHDPGLLSLMGRLLHGEAVVLGVETFSKPALVGSAVPYHQDNAYFNLVPPDSLTCWIALDDSTLENGCVLYARGSHHELRPHTRSGVKGNSLKMAEPPASGEFEEVPGNLPRGGAILHHCVLMHRSEPNRSARPRRGLLIVYRGAHCTKDRAAEEAYRAVLATMS